MIISVSIFRRKIFLLVIVLFYDQFAALPNSLVSLAVYWTLAKCTFTIVIDAEMAN